MNLTPFGTRVVLKETKVTEDPKSLIYIPEEFKDKTMIAEIVAFGTDLYSDGNPPLPIGTKVRYDKYSGTKFKDDDGEEYLIQDYSDLLGSVK
jgi:co-chaperonin GroES (HSP10)